MRYTRKQKSIVELDENKHERKRKGEKEKREESMLVYTIKG